MDAFVSHSWQDDGRAKFEALRAWAARFAAEHGREPLLWLDKACIDQQNIGASLAGIPVYVRAGSPGADFEWWAGLSLYMRMGAGGGAGGAWRWRVGG